MNDLPLAAPPRHVFLYLSFTISYPQSLSSLISFALSSRALTRSDGGGMEAARRLARSAAADRVRRGCSGRSDPASGSRWVSRGGGGGMPGLASGGRQASRGVVVACRVRPLAERLLAGFGLLRSAGRGRSAAACRLRPPAAGKAHIAEERQLFQQHMEPPLLKFPE
ncbi:hypothetical protein PVAP13_8NG214900 [Panicum virgatum]|uniref:Uncharacterized protein n=1 Tax=Panicum virgatum TaxID=38727 RepID=A0A8T0PA83_PANVG|nr:hypothetical protein PVAP13_8NG214900 [Panicum virgatum]